MTNHIFNEYLFSYKKLRRFARVVFIMPLLAFTSSLIGAQATEEASSVMELSQTPLFATGIVARPTLALALSVEYPTVGTQYRTASYSPQTEYIGYFNHNLCYKYESYPSVPDGIYDGDSSGYFKPIGSVTNSNHGCGGTGFSGNFMNWATSSAVDIMRFSLAGGDRIVDKENFTLLQRAFLEGRFYNNDGYFERKILAPDQVSDALPAGFAKRVDGTPVTGNVYISNCYARTYFTANGRGGCVNSGRSNEYLGTAFLPSSESYNKPYFFTRVEVCHQDANGKLLDVRTINGKEYPLCQKYPSGYYKPVGQLQKYSDSLRVAAFGYPFIPSVTCIRAGVLRAPMKYVGPTQYNENYQPIGDNPHKEWDPQTGIFYVNPENDPQYQSGVINYVNKFGRTAPEVAGHLYKDCENALEMYYETLRYLQGLKPTPKAVEKLDGPGAYQGFAAYKEWQDPHPVVPSIGADGDYSCVKNNIVFIGDRFFHYANNAPGYNFERAPSDKRNEPNLKYWTEVVGGFEGGISRSYVDANNVTRNTLGNPKPYPPRKDMATWDPHDDSRAFVVGAAYWGLTHDIRGEQWTDLSQALVTEPNPIRRGMRVRSFFIDVNERNESDTIQQRRENAYVYAGKYGAFDEEKSLGGNPFTTDGQNFTDALWERDSQQLFPKGYFLASDAEAVLKAFEDIFASVAVSNSYSIAGLANSGEYSNVIRVGDAIFQSRFVAGTWSSDLTANTVKTDSKNNYSLVSVTGWSAADKLNKMKWQDRKIYVGKGDGTASALTSISSLPDFSAKNMEINLPADINVQDCIDYLRGDRSKEGTFLRARDSILGDIINSVPVYKQAPSQIGYGEGYSKFYTDNKDRTPVVYVGGNDGMLHAFNAELTGDDAAKELFAYIPSFVTANLYKLTLKDYEHEYFVDAPLTVSEAQLEVADNKVWKTVLVGGAGAGGQGVYALDVSNPQSFNNDNLLWEFTDKDDADIGNVMGAPSIVRLPTNDPANPYQWFAVVPGGVNNAQKDGHVSSSGSPYMFFLNLSKPASETWKEGTNYYKVNLPAKANRLSGLLNITAVTNKRSILQAIYAGDLSGQVWKILFDPVKKEFSRQELFTVESDTQSISMPLIVATDGTFNYVSFGTGIYIRKIDNSASSFHTQTIYTIRESSQAVKPSQLRKVEVSGTNGDGSIQFKADPFSWGSATQAVNDAKSNGKLIRAGWYFDLPDSQTTGERMIYQMALRNGVLVVNSLLPSVGGCSGGSSKRYSINIFSGVGRYRQYPGVILGSSYIVENGSNVLIDSNTGLPQVGSQAGTGGAGSNGPDLDSNDKFPGTALKALMNWREISNYNQLLTDQFKAD